MALDDLCQNFVCAQYLENELMEFDQILHMHCLGWDSYASIFTFFFFVLALDRCQNFVSTQYLDNKLMKFD